MMMDKRKFLIGSAATLFAAPAIVRIASIMPVRVYDPLVIGIVYQSWEWNELKPEGHYIAGTVTSTVGPRSLSTFLDEYPVHIDGARRIWPNLVVKAVNT